MNVNLEGVDVKATAAHTNVGRETTSYRTPQGSQGVRGGNVALDISGTVMDNSAYAGHGRTAEEVMLAAGQEDITVQRNYMAVMSNCMSEEDFARLQKEGFHPGSTDVETVVTIVDHIKAALIKSGVQVTGYTDTLGEEVLRDITGSEAFARELEKQFALYDIPMNEENAAAAAKAWDMLSQTDSLSEGSVKYMVENGMEPTAENLYTAKYSGAQDAGRQGKGYYAAGEVAGYYARKPEQIDYQNLLPQMQKVIEEAGFQADEEALQDAKWLLEKGMPLNTDTFSLYRQVKGVQLPVSEEEFAKAAAAAIADGILPWKTEVDRTETYIEQAKELVEQVGEIKEQTVDLIKARELPLTLRNLLAAQDQLRQGRIQREQTAPTEYTQGRRLLAEVRMTMTFEVNLRLLRSGYQIDTAPLEQLLEKLKDEETDIACTLAKDAEISEAKEKQSLFWDTLQALRGIAASPAAMLAEITATDTLSIVYTAGIRRTESFQQVNQSYEALMTAPRADMGDSIRKAFRNVDDILADMEIEPSEENRRAVRILGYNSMDITKGSVEEIRQKDRLLTGVVREMKPGRVLNMIREGVNPLNMPLEELRKYLADQEDPAREMESYSKFLYKLEKQDAITQEERSAYIGIYRLVRQLEKGDDAAVGALLGSGGEFTLGNLLTAQRSSRRKGMDYSVDDSFGGVNARNTGVETIFDQIARGFAQNGQVDLGEARALLENAGSKEAEAEFEHMQYEQLKAAIKSEEAVLQQLMDYGQPVNADYLLAAGNMLKNPREIWQQIVGVNKKEDSADTREKSLQETELEAAGADVIEALESKEQAQKAYTGLQELVQEVLSETALAPSSQALDVRAMSMLYKQMSFMGSMAKEENYEIPAEINGQLTSINLKIIHGSGEESKATVTFETPELGKTAARFKLTQKGVTGFCMCSMAGGTELLQKNRQSFEARMEREHIAIEEIYFATGDNLNLAEFTSRETKDRQAGSGTQELYLTAKSFIGYVQETVAQKGNTEYENRL